MIVGILSLAMAQTTVVDLHALYNHDLFTTGDGPAPYYRISESSAASLPFPMHIRVEDSPDVLLMAPGQSYSIPVGSAGHTIYLLTAGYGSLESRDIAADGTLRYANGQVQNIKWLVGEHAWPAWAGATGRSADPVALGRNPSGDLLTASLLTVPLAYPDVPLTSVEVKARNGSLKLALLSLSISTEAPAPVQAERLDSSPRWYDFPLRTDRPLPGLVPPQPHGFLKVESGRLTWEDGRPARFWGVNLVGNGAIPPKGEAAAWADRVAASGFDMVRLHHIDGEEALLNPLRGQPGQPAATPEALDRLDEFVAELGKRHIAVFVEGLTKRVFKASEGVTAPEGVAVGNKLAIYLWDDWLEAEKNWLRLLYGRVNPYTQKRWSEDQAVALVELANENSLLVAWNSGALERLPAPHRSRLDALWNQWLTRRYGTDEKLSRAWAGSSRSGLLLGETLMLESVGREPLLRSRADLFPTARAADLVRFYSELERKHQRAMLDFFKTELGFRVPVICNTSFNYPHADALLDDCDVVDLHLYWDPLQELHVFSNTSMIKQPGRILERLAGCQEGKACTMSEIQHAWPNRHVQEAPLLWAALGARQELDALLWFAWSHGPMRAAPDGPDGALDLEGRFNAWAQLPAASALYRRLPSPKRRFVRWWSPDGLLRELSEVPGLWLDPLMGWRSSLENVLRSSFSPRPAPIFARQAPDSGGLDWRPEEGIFSVDRPDFQALVGETKGKATSGLASDISRFVALSLYSLEGGILGEGPALLTLVGRCEREGTVWSSGGPGLLAWGRGPARLEQLEGRLRFSWPKKPKVWTLWTDGQPLAKVPVRRKAGMWEVEVEELYTPWLRIE